jgi:predicted lipoprotein with Yx(FWY)xxD motif
MDKLPYPAEVSLIHRRTGWLFRAAPSNLRLYAYDADLPGKSVCNDACSAAWPPLIAPAGATPLGDWTSVVRDDGRSQWAYKGHPAYTRRDDSLHPPAGDGIDGAWHFLEP